MNRIISDLIFPKYCCICKKHGEYLCDRCKKQFKRNLPECYICRRISVNFSTHSKCKSLYSLESVKIAYEYNKISSVILKLFKYKGNFDIAKNIATLLTSSIANTLPNDTLLVPAPISFLRRNDRGFNQMELIVKHIANEYGVNYSFDLIKRKIDHGHQSLRDREQRLSSINNSFYIKSPEVLKDYSSVTIVDDVITTGTTLESISKVIKESISIAYPVNAICIFRGKPRYCF